MPAARLKGRKADHLHSRTAYSRLPVFYPSNLPISADLWHTERGRTLRGPRCEMTDETERFWYPFTATTVIARRLVPLLLLTLGVGLFILAGRELYSWRRP